jgi:hypothetical protein
MTPSSALVKLRSAPKLLRQVNSITQTHSMIVTDFSHSAAAHSAQLSYEMTMKSVAMLHRLASGMNRR